MCVYVYMYIYIRVLISTPIFFLLTVVLNLQSLNFLLQTENGA